MNNHPAEITNYYYAPTPEAREYLRKYILITLRPTYYPIPVYETKGFCTCLRGVREARLFLLDGISFPELELEIKQRAGKIEVVNVIGKDTLDVVLGPLS